ncbi:MAG TPA: helix-turn-helix domain-containing protein, partial [Caldilineaceae bacterium]|nr:helix-turn-helix domain-containing protein [Caldilineaceae bacterium]
LVQGLVAVESHGYRLFSPLLTDYLALRFGAGGASVPASQPETGAVQALVEREAHRFTPQEKSLMLYFLERPGTIVSVDELLADVWQKPDGSVRRVQEGIRRLRQRLAEFNGAVGTIDNEWGQGYRYVPVG